jgi:hypothetical protein
MVNMNRFSKRKDETMAISAELSKSIEKEAAVLKSDEYRRPAMSINRFIAEYSGNLAQAKEDMDELVAAGFDAGKMPRYRALLEMLSLSHGERLGTTPESPEKRARFNKLMAEAEMDRKRLGVVGAHITEQCGDAKVRRNWRTIVKGSGMVDTCIDNLSLIAMVKEFPELASQIRPGGKEISAKYLEEVTGRAVELLQLKGIVVEKGVPQNAAVDRQNRLLTLCLNAQSDIKKYANAAFFDTIEYYKSNYASSSARSAPEVEAAAAELPEAA